MKLILKINMKAINLIIVLLFCIFTISYADERETTILNNEFFKTFSRIPTIARDEYIKNLTDKQIAAKGRYINVIKCQKYGKNYKVIIESNDATNYNQKIIFYLYTDDAALLKISGANQTIEFNGKLINSTALNIYRNAYILDILIINLSITD